MFLRQRVYVGSVILFSLLISTTNLPMQGSEDSICPDMSQSRAILEEGENYYTEHDGYSSRNPVLPTMGLYAGNFKYQASQPRPKKFIEAQFIVSQSDSHPVIFSDEQIDKLPLKTKEQIDTARLTASYYESIGDDYLAKRLYQKILDKITTSSCSNKTAHDQLTEDLARINLWRTAITNEFEHQFEEAAITYHLILINITKQNNIELENKLKLASLASSRLNGNMFNNIEAAKKGRLEACQLCNEYKKKLGCLQMARELDSSAWRLEKSGMYVMAEKLYRQSLEIKEKNLGRNDPNTLAVYGDLARLHADQNQYTEAEDIYRQTLAAYRKLADPGKPYITMLENYGDMLNQIKQSSRAAEIYNEAKAHYSEL